MTCDSCTQPSPDGACTYAAVADTPISDSRPAPYWEGGGITLYHGDCREVTEWLTADVLVTDPPYGIAVPRRFGRYQQAGSHAKRENVMIQDAVIGDRDTTARDDALQLWGSAPWIVFGSWRVPRPSATDHRLIWHKAGCFSGPLNAAFMSQDEEIYVHGKGFRKSSPPLMSVITTQELRQNQSRLVGHPTPKPISLMQTLIDRCPPGAIADPFAGSGSTLVAAKLQGRNAIGVELEERYCEIAARRLDQGVLDFGDTA